MQYIKDKEGKIEENPEDISLSDIYVLNESRQVIENKQFVNKDKYIKDKEGKIVRG